jgi:hypothetical protein
MTDTSPHPVELVCSLRCQVSGGHLQTMLCVAIFLEMWRGLGNPPHTRRVPGILGCAFPFTDFSH